MKKIMHLVTIMVILFMIGFLFTACPEEEEIEKEIEIEYTIMVFPEIPNGSILVSHSKAIAGEGIAVIADPDAGYYLDDVFIIGANVITTGTGNFRMFTMPSANITVIAVFEPFAGLFKASVAEGITGGFVNVSPGIPVTVGTLITVTASPNSGYQLLNIFVTGADVTLNGTDNTRTFQMPAANVTVHAAFELIPILYTASVAEGITGGKITLSPDTPVTPWTLIVITSQPDPGNQLASVTVTGADVTINGTGGTRNFFMPAANVTVSATFAPSAYLEVTATGPFWANNWVNNAQSQITLTVVFDDATGRIANINYVPLNSHISESSNALFFGRWTTNDSPQHPGTFRNYVNSMTGLLASVVSQFQRPVGPVAGITGNHGIAGLTIDAVTGATETGRNFVSSVVLASQRYLAGEGLPSSWRP